MQRYIPVHRPRERARPPRFAGRARGHQEKSARPQTFVRERARERAPGCPGAVARTRERKGARAGARARLRARTRAGQRPRASAASACALG
eukprot:3175461-Lingulodinium_polyedra.AAC.1